MERAETVRNIWRAGSGTAKYHSISKKIYKGREDEVKDLTSYWMTLRKCNNIGN
jgi:hypothetical protein